MRAAHTLTPAPGDAGVGVALVTVTHQSRPDLERLLGSVQRHLPQAKVVVVDCASSDGSAEAARRWDGDARVLALPDNLGYGRATNAGVATVSEPVTVIANPDVELVDDSLGQLAAEVAQGRPRILAPLVLLPGGAREDSAQRRPAGLAMALSAVLPPAALPASLRVRLEPWRDDRPRPVAWAVGCCLIARTQTLRALGPFDERIFMYGEDTELGLRAGEQGIRTWFHPGGRVIHHRAHSTTPAFGGEPLDLLARQRRAVLEQRLGPRRRALDDAIQLVTFADRLLLKRLAGRPDARERGQLSALWRARREPPQRAQR